MTPKAIVTDLDRTLTGTDLVLDASVPGRMRLLRASGIRVVLATGRTLEDLVSRDLPALVDAVVAENGCIVSLGATGPHEVVGVGFRDAARAGLGDLEAAFHWGRVVGSGPRRLAGAARERLREARVGHAIEFNADEVMLLPPGVSKASGVERGLHAMGIPSKDCWAIGDGENDASLLRLVGLGAAPANAAEAARSAAGVHLASSYAKAFLDLTEPLVSATSARGAATPH